MSRLSYRSRVCSCSSKCCTTYVNQSQLSQSFIYSRSSCRISNTLSPKRSKLRTSRQKIASPLQHNQRLRRKELRKAKLGLPPCQPPSSWRISMKMLSARIASAFLLVLTYENTPYLRRTSILKSMRCCWTHTRPYTCWCKRTTKQPNSATRRPFNAASQWAAM